MLQGGIDMSENRFGSKGGDETLLFFFILLVLIWPFFFRGFGTKV
jgi:hypothetical protein